VEILQHTIRQTGLGKEFGDLFHNGRSLRRWLEDDAVASENGWDQRVDEDQVWILRAGKTSADWTSPSRCLPDAHPRVRVGGFGVTHIPCEENEHRADGHLPNESLEALLSFTVCVLERLITDLEKIFCSLYRSGNLLAGVGNRPPHLHSELFSELTLMAGENLEELLDNLLPLLQ
jgi:hypothetical protein